MRGQSHTSHFETPNGVSVWLATIVRCLWHHVLAGYPYLMPFASFISRNQTIKPRPCCGGLKDQQSYSPRQRPGCCMACGDSALEGHKHSLSDKAFAPVGRTGCYVPVTPGCYPGLVAQCPFQGRKWQLGWGIVYAVCVRLCVVLQWKKCR